MSFRDPILERFGFELSGGGWAVGAGAKLPTYVHHTEEPVLVAALALAHGNVPVDLAVQFANYRLRDLVLKRPALDLREAGSLLSACSASLPQPIPVHAYAEFYEALCKAIGKCELESFFDTIDEADFHYKIRPLGYRQDTDKQAFEKIVKEWRRRFRQLPEQRQMMLSSIIWLYRGCDDKTWLRRLSTGWTAIHALRSMRSAGVLADWARLVALYPGW